MLMVQLLNHDFLFYTLFIKMVRSGKLRCLRLLVLRKVIRKSEGCIEKLRQIMDNKVRLIICGLPGLFAVLPRMEQEIMILNHIRIIKESYKNHMRVIERGGKKWNTEDLKRSRKRYPFWAWAECGFLFWMISRTR